MSRKSVFGIEVHGVVRVGEVQSSRKRIFIFRNGNQVDMIGHQCVGPNADAVPDTSLLQGTHVDQKISVFVKKRFLSNAALIHVVRIARQNITAGSGHRNLFLVGLQRCDKNKSGPDRSFTIF
jgi:hypothetical protein